MVDKEKIKAALDSFENDDFINSKETIASEIRNHMNDYFKTKLNLKNDVIDVQTDESDVE